MLKLRACLINQKHLMPMCYRRYRRQTSVLLDIADLSVHSLYLPCSPYRLSVCSFTLSSLFSLSPFGFVCCLSRLICVRVCVFLHRPRLSPAFKDAFFLPPFLFSRIYLCQCTGRGRWGVKNNLNGTGEEDQRESTIGCANGREQYLHPHRHLCLESWDPPDSAKKNTSRIRETTLTRSQDSSSRRYSFL